MFLPFSCRVDLYHRRTSDRRRVSLLGHRRPAALLLLGGFCLDVSRGSPVVRHVGASLRSREIQDQVVLRRRVSLSLTIAVCDYD